MQALEFGSCRPLAAVLLLQHRTLDIPTIPMPCSAAAAITIIARYQLTIVVRSNDDDGDTEIAISHVEPFQSGAIYCVLGHTHILRRRQAAQLL